MTISTSCLTTAHTIEVWLSGIQPGADYDLYLLDKDRAASVTRGTGAADDHILTTEVENVTDTSSVYREGWRRNYTLRVVYQ